MSYKFIQKQWLSVWCCRYQQRLLLRRRWTLVSCMDRGHSMYHRRPQITRENLESAIKMHHNQDWWWGGDKKILKGNGSLGHRCLPQLKWTLNLKMTRLRTCGSPISFKFSRSHGGSVLVETRDFPDLKTNTNKIAIWEPSDNLCIYGRRPLSYGLFSKSGSGAMHF